MIRPYFNSASFFSKPVIATMSATLLFAFVSTAIWNKSAQAFEWQKISLRSQQGTDIIINYQTTTGRIYDGSNTTMATPIWINLVVPEKGNGTCPNFVEIRLMSYSKSNYDGDVPHHYEGAQIQRAYLDNQTSGTCYYSAEFSRAIIKHQFFYRNIVHRYREEMAISIDGEWQVDPINGTHNFKFNF